VVRGCGVEGDRVFDVDEKVVRGRRLTRIYAAIFALLCVRSPETSLSLFLYFMHVHGNSIVEERSNVSFVVGSCSLKFQRGRDTSTPSFIKERFQVLSSRIKKTLENSILLNIVVE
jgi:hypothetical protein